MLITQRSTRPPIIYLCFNLCSLKNRFDLWFVLRCCTPQLSSRASASASFRRRAAKTSSSSGSTSRARHTTVGNLLSATAPLFCSCAARPLPHPSALPKVSKAGALKSSSIAPPHDKMALFIIPLLKPRVSRYGNWALMARKNSHLTTTLVLVSLLLDNLEPTLVVCL